MQRGKLAGIARASFWGKFRGVCYLWILWLCSILLHGYATWLCYSHPISWISIISTNFPSLPAYYLLSRAVVSYLLREVARPAQKSSLATEQNTQLDWKRTKRYYSLGCDILSGWTLKRALNMHTKLTYMLLSGCVRKLSRRNRSLWEEILRIFNENFTSNLKWIP